MGSAASGRTITANAQTDAINERLAGLRDELREAMADEAVGLTALAHAESNLRHVGAVARRANDRVRRCSAALALWQRELGDSGIVIDELDDTEAVRVDGLTHRLPRNGDVARFDHGVKADARRRVG